MNFFHRNCLERKKAVVMTAFFDMLESCSASHGLYSDGYLFFAPEFCHEASVFHREMEGEILEVVV